MVLDTAYFTYINAFQSCLFPTLFEWNLWGFLHRIHRIKSYILNILRLAPKQGKLMSLSHGLRSQQTAFDLHLWHQWPISVLTLTAITALYGLELCACKVWCQCLIIAVGCDLNQVSWKWPMEDAQKVAIHHAWNWIILLGVSYSHSTLSSIWFSKVTSTSSYCSSIRCACSWCLVYTFHWICGMHISISAKRQIFSFSGRWLVVFCACLML